MRRNPSAPQRDRTEANERKTQDRIQQYYGKQDLLRTWELMPDETQIKFHDDILKLRATVRNVKNYLLHRAGPDADL